MPPPLQRAKMMREQLGFALNREGRFAEAEEVLKEVIAEFGPSSETNGLLGRIYKDRWEIAREIRACRRRAASCAAPSTPIWKGSRPTGATPIRASTRSP